MLPLLSLDSAVQAGRQKERPRYGQTLTPVRTPVTQTHLWSHFKRALSRWRMLRWRLTMAVRLPGNQSSQSVQLWCHPQRTISVPVANGSALLEALWRKSRTCCQTRYVLRSHPTTPDLHFRIGSLWPVPEVSCRMRASGKSKENGPRMRLLHRSEAQVHSPGILGTGNPRRTSGQA
jgi:hypothetical protein